MSETIQTFQTLDSNSKISLIIPKEDLSYVLKTLPYFEILLKETY